MYLHQPDACYRSDSSLCEAAQMLFQSRAAAYGKADAVKSGDEML